MTFCREIGQGLLLALKLLIGLYAITLTFKLQDLYIKVINNFQFFKISLAIWYAFRKLLLELSLEKIDGLAFGFSDMYLFAVFVQKTFWYRSTLFLSSPKFWTGSIKALNLRRVHRNHELFKKSWILKSVTVTYPRFTRKTGRERENHLLALVIPLNLTLFLGVDGQDY